MSVVKVLLTTAGLFFTLGNMMPPFRDMGFDEDDVNCDAVDEDEEELLVVVEDEDEVVEVV